MVCTLCVILAHAGVVGDNELYGELPRVAAPAVDRSATGAWDVLSEMRALGRLEVEGPVLQIVRECGGAFCLRAASSRRHAVAW